MLNEKWYVCEYCGEHSIGGPSYTVYVFGQIFYFCSTADRDKWLDGRKQIFEAPKEGV